MLEKFVLDKNTSLRRCFCLSHKREEKDMFGLNTADIGTSIRTSPLGAAVRFALDKRATPGIDFLWGERLLALDEYWYNELEAITCEEPHLLFKSREELEPAARRGHVILAVDRNENNRVAGCIVLWELDRDDQGEMWYELGTYVVAREYRFKSGTQRSMPIGDILYRLFLHRYRDRNILGTTTNIKAIHIGQRHGMQMISFDQLPPGICQATCVCGIDKTGSEDFRSCSQRDGSCRVRVPYQTWRRLGSPERLPYP